MLPHRARVLVLAALLPWAGCRTAGETAARFEGAACSADLPACVARLVDRHGGMDRARGHRFAAYSLAWGRTWLPPPAPAPEAHQERTLWSDRLGEAVTVGELDHETERAVHQFLAMPFRLAVDLEVVEASHARWRDMELLALDVATRGAGGRPPRPAWRLYVDPRNFVVVGGSTRLPGWRGGVDFQVEGYHVVAGLLVPRRVALTHAALTIPRAVVEVRDVKLWPSRPPAWPAAH